MPCLSSGFTYRYFDLIDDDDDHFLWPSHSLRVICILIVGTQMSFIGRVTLLCMHITLFERVKHGQRG